jgi:hypothetical protein
MSRGAVSPSLYLCFFPQPRCGAGGRGKRRSSTDGKVNLTVSGKTCIAAIRRSTICLPLTSRGPIGRTLITAAPNRPPKRSNSGQRVQVQDFLHLRAQPIEGPAQVLRTARTKTPTDARTTARVEIVPTVYRPLVSDLMEVLTSWAARRLR